MAGILDPSIVIARRALPDADEDDATPFRRPGGANLTAIAMSTATAATMYARPALLPASGCFFERRHAIF